MLITMHLVFLTADVREAMNQTVDAFRQALTSACERQNAFEKIKTLAFCFDVAHPALQSPAKRRRASYSRDSGVFFTDGDLSYEAWLGDNWAARVQAVASAAETGLSRVHKTRLTVEERETLSRLIRIEAAKVEASPPDRLFALKPIYAVEDGTGKRLSLGFQPPEPLMTPGGPIVREIRPLAVLAYCAGHTEPAGGVQTVKLYKRRDDRLLYREAWADGDKVVEHVGVCGDRGSISEHAAEGSIQQKREIAAIAADARAQGFRSISESRHVGLLVSRDISEAGSPDDLERRHALEDFLDQVTGRLGLGHCDGGSTGSRSMEAFCLVVDYDIAAQAIERELATSPFSDFTVRRADP